jgi:catechol 2,3-dioxygenase-like lactoylglutathione lyase family enzyme
MSLVQGVHHVTFLTEDIERLSAFYRRVFDAITTLDMTEEGVRHVSWRWARRRSSIPSRSEPRGQPPDSPQDQRTGASAEAEQHFK